MWYEQILMSLLVKVKPDERAKAQDFISQLFGYLPYLAQQEHQPFCRYINNIIWQRILINSEVIDELLNIHYPDRNIPFSSFSNLLHEIKKTHGATLANIVQTSLQQNYTSEEPLPFELVLGVIYHMHKQFAGQKDNSVSYVGFAQHLFALVLIYTKVTTEDKVTNKHFHAFFCSNNILQILRLTGQYTLSDLSRKINRIEISKLKQMDYAMTIDFNVILRIVSSHNSLELLNAMVDYFQLSSYLSPFPYIVEKDDHFVKFVLSLQRMKHDLEIEIQQAEYRRQLAITSHSSSFFTPITPSRTLQKDHTETLPSTSSYNPFFGGDLFAEAPSQFREDGTQGRPANSSTTQAQIQAPSTSSYSAFFGADLFAKARSEFGESKDNQVNMMG
ncbi:Uncharacterised protein [Legionella lansingensis]|uniref:Uncharacterized protein n=1 Tax=Legionella lansingensis TaxID=45067 RepID=A0A0W0W1M9_9GAMM|nr:hypothetical protein [Legionella lansingensis]KTD26147.1 hypothetical protein Llan_0042 [Legionella lansingensis]SNV52711.1 Uncharacterised protein [Legionella lansingensis]